jgi:hypothetical protein
MTKSFRYQCLFIALSESYRCATYLCVLIGWTIFILAPKEFNQFYVFCLCFIGFALVFC